MLPETLASFSLSSVSCELCPCQVYMFNIAINQNKYLTYILKDLTSNSRLEVVPERGGMVSKWSLQGQEILYLDEERFNNPNLSVRGGIPVLFPICGNLPDNIFSYDNQNYHLKQHGFARDLPWQVLGQSTSDSAKIILSLKSNPQTLEVYPFEFELIFSYELKENQLIIHQSYENKSSQVMPFCFGFHPYFYCDDKNQLSLNFPVSEYQSQTGQQIYPFNGQLDYDLPEIDIAFTKLQKNTASFDDRQRELRVVLNYSDSFSTLVFWTLKDKDYICVEPWSSPRNSINTGEKLSYLQPQQTCSETFIIEVQSIIS
jgi:galactose mutarotase-like enzyme